MKVAYSCETIRRHIPQDSNCYTHHLQNLKSHIFFAVSGPGITGIVVSFKFPPVLRPDRPEKKKISGNSINVFISPSAEEFRSRKRCRGSAQNPQVTQTFGTEQMTDRENKLNIL